METPSPTFPRNFAVDFSMAEQCTRNWKVARKSTGKNVIPHSPFKIVAGRVFPMLCIYSRRRLKYKWNKTWWEVNKALYHFWLHPVSLMIFHFQYTSAKDQLLSQQIKNRLPKPAQKDWSCKVSLFLGSNEFSYPASSGGLTVVAAGWWRVRHQ